MRRCSWPPVLLRCASVSVEHVAHAGGPNSTEDSGCLAGGGGGAGLLVLLIVPAARGRPRQSHQRARRPPKSHPRQYLRARPGVMGQRAPPPASCASYTTLDTAIYHPNDGTPDVSANPRLDRKDNGARAQMQAGIGIASWHTILLLLVRHKVREVPLPQLQFHVLERPNVTRTSVHLHEQALALSPAQLPTCCPTGQAA